MVAERFDIPFGEFSRACDIAGMRVQRAATNLQARGVGRKVIDRQYASRGLIDATEESLGDATLEQKERTGHIACPDSFLLSVTVCLTLRR